MRLLRWTQSALLNNLFKVASGGLSRPPRSHMNLRRFATKPMNKPGLIIVGGGAAVLDALGFESVGAAKSPVTNGDALDEQLFKRVGRGEIL